MAKGNGTTRSSGGASSSRSSESISDSVSSVVTQSASDKLSNPNQRLAMSDLKFSVSTDEEAGTVYIGIDREPTELKTWSTGKVTYKDAEGNTKTSEGFISQSLEDSSVGMYKVIGKYQVYFDKAGPIGEADTLEGAKQLLLARINKLRKG